MNEGPSLEAMMDRLAAIPAVFTEDFNKAGSSHSGPVLTDIVNDLLLDTGDRPISPDEIKTLESSAGKKNYQRLIAILCHIYHDPFFIENRPAAGLIRKLFFSQKLPALGAVIDNENTFISDPDRREELCRLALISVNMFPRGEDEKRAKERLATLDSIERKKILDKTREAQQRAREIREAMLRKEAEEAASKMSRE